MHHVWFMIKLMLLRGCGRYVIIYADALGTSSQSSSSNSKIPAFYDKKEVGDKLKQELTQNEAESTTPQDKKIIRVVMIPSSGSFNGGWQIAIIVIGSILAVS